MRQYIVDLTNDLIRRNHFDRACDFMTGNKISFLKQATIDLLIGDIAQMRPETLGKIMASFEIGDVMVNRQEIFENVTFSGDCEDFLREIVSFCLAAAIFERLESEPARNPDIPAYRRTISS